MWLIEDSATDAYVIGEVLKDCGFEHDLQVISDGDVALQMLRAATGEEGRLGPDLLLLDLNVPKVPGLDLLSYVRHAPEIAGIPVVVVTSSDSPGDLAAMQKLGATAYFRKPADLDEFMALCDVIRAALPSAR